jgi:periplasmic protein TonB
MFPGGNAKWKEYLGYRFQHSAIKNTIIPNGEYTVVLQFVIDKNGNISGIKPLTKHGYGMEKEAIGWVANGPRWQPAITNGKPISYYHKQRITFVIKKEKSVY